MEHAEPTVRFEWPMYADATLAGLSILVPVPFMDDAFEGLFRRRMTRALARRRGMLLDDDVFREISRGEGSWLSGCLMLPVWLVVELAKKLSRKLLYFLTVKESSEQLSHYWHRAFLLDYMLASGHLETLDSARRARLAMDHVLKGTASPLTQLARQVVSEAKRVPQALRHARAGQEDETVDRARSRLAERWGEFAQYLGELAERYEAEYQRLQLQPG